MQYKFGKEIGYHDGHFWRATGDVHELDEALGAAYGCNGENGPARRGLVRVRGYDVYRTAEGGLVAVSCLDARRVEEVA
jgi:hypothetical protein